MENIKPGGLYTTVETQKIRLSKSLIKRLLKSGLTCANEIGGQYRTPEHEIFRLSLPNWNEE